MGVFVSSKRGVFLVRSRCVHVMFFLLVSTLTTGCVTLHTGIKGQSNQEEFTGTKVQKSSPALHLGIGLETPVPFPLGIKGSQNFESYTIESEGRQYTLNGQAPMFEVFVGFAWNPMKRAFGIGHGYWYISGGGYSYEPPKPEPGEVTDPNDPNYISRTKKHFTLKSEGEGGTETSFFVNQARRYAIGYCWSAAAAAHTWFASAGAIAKIAFELGYTTQVIYEESDFELSRPYDRKSIELGFTASAGGGLRYGNRVRGP